MNDIYESFERAWPGCHYFYIYSPLVQHSDNFDYRDAKNVVFFDNEEEIAETILNRIDKISLVIFQGLWAPYKQILINKIKGKVQTHGIIWGYMLYADNLLLNPLLPITAKAMHKEGSKNRSLKTKFKNIIKNYIYNEAKLRIKEIQRLQLQHIRSFDSISTLLPSEEKVLYKKFNKLPKHYPFKYQLNLNSNTIQGNSKNILIGNSLANWSNHLDVLRKVENINLVSGSKVILPISYGHSILKEKIKQDYSNTFNINVQFLEDFLPLKEYEKIINSCGFVVLYTLRQQALGNVYLSLLKGVKLFLHPKGMLFRDLNDQGFLVFSLNDFYKEYPRLLTDFDRKKNHELVFKHRGEKEVDRLIRNLNHAVKS